MVVLILGSEVTIWIFVQDNSDYEYVLLQNCYESRPIEQRRVFEEF
jgi:hypothetical protein